MVETGKGDPVAFCSKVYMGLGLKRSNEEWLDDRRKEGRGRGGGVQQQCDQILKEDGCPNFVWLRYKFV